jgi:hypothetical protein
MKEAAMPKTRALHVTTLWLLVLIASAAFTGEKQPVITDFSWLTGDWETTFRDARIEEHWGRPDGGMMMGMGRTVRGEKTTTFEYLRVEARPDGIFYVAHLGGGPATDFKLASWDGTEAVFVNPGHADHLKKIIYRKIPDGSMTARIEGEDKGKAFSQEWHFQRSRQPPE